MKKKVLFIAHVQSHIMNFHLPFLKYFNEKKYEVFVATNMDRKKYNDLKSLDFINWIDIDYPRNPLSKNIIKAFFQTRELMIENDFDLIHTHTPVGGIIGRLSNLFAKKNKILYTAHGFHFYKGSDVKNWLLYFNLEKLMAKCTDTIITINEEDYLMAKKHFKTKQEIVKINGVGVDLKKYKIELNEDKRKELNIKEGCFIMSVIAELIDRKNHIQLIEAIKDLDKEFKILIIGDGEKSLELKQLIEKYKLNSKVEFLGFRKDIGELINISDCIGLFSKQEGLPKNIMEAMAAGKYIICTDVRGNKDLIIDGVNGSLVKLNNIEDTKEKIKFAIENIDLIKQIGKVNFEKVNIYEEKKIINEMSLVYKKITELG